MGVGRDIFVPNVAPRGTSKMGSNWRNTTAMGKIKKLKGYICQECGGSDDIQAHHIDGKEGDRLIVLCGRCHSLKHPELAVELFVNKKVHFGQLKFNDDVLPRRDAWTGRRNWFIFGDIIVYKDTKTYDYVRNIKYFDLLKIRG